MSTPDSARQHSSLSPGKVSNTIQQQIAVTKHVHHHPDRPHIRSAEVHSYPRLRQKNSALNTPRLLRVANPFLYTKYNKGPYFRRLL